MDWKERIKDPDGMEFKGHQTHHVLTSLIFGSVVCSCLVHYHEAGGI